MQATATFAIAYAVGFHWDATTLAATILFSLAIVTPALRLGHGLDYVAAGRSAAVRLATALNEPTLPAGEALTVPAASPSDHLEIVDLTVTITDRRVVDGVTHAFRPAAITAITGPSGAGKSTLLKALAGFEIPELGTVRYAGRSITAIDENLRPPSVLLTPQGADVLPATVRENIALAAPPMQRTRNTPPHYAGHRSTSASMPTPLHSPEENVSASGLLGCSSRPQQYCCSTSRPVHSTIARPPNC